MRSLCPDVLINVFVSTRRRSKKATKTLSVYV
jgi:hypothetical protein